MRLDQSANPVVVWLGLVSRVVRSSWSREVLVHWCLYPNTPLWPSRGHELADSGITGTHPPRPRRHSSDFIVSSPQHCDLDEFVVTLS